MLKRLLCLLTVTLLALSTIAQVTTSSVTGVVKTGTGETLTGASITALHEPTGTSYTAVTSSGGRYQIYNMKPGGPYTFTVTYVGYKTDRRGDVSLGLGESPSIDFVLEGSAGALTEVVVTSRRATAPKLGSETNIGRDKIQNLPSVGRNLSDFVRFTPQAKITANGGFSLAGQNNRFNTFMIDGAVNNDVFGLSDQGTNGGRTGASPISIDAVDQMVVQISPFDVSLGNFTGGGINAITRSGTNDYHGSAYYIFRNQNLTGRNPLETLKPGSASEFERSKLPDFTNKTYGARIGGPILRNKAFFFLNFERQEDERPQPFDSTTYRGSALRDRSIDQLIGTLRSRFNYDPGQYISNPDLVNATRIASRFDFNLSAKHQLMASYRFTKLDRTNPGRSSLNTLNFYNNAEYFPSTTHSGSLELNSRFTNSMTNKLRVNFTNVVDDRGTIGNPFPSVTIRDGSANINFGAESASAANLLEQNTINLYDNFRYVRGKHSLSAGFDIDLNKSYNLFMNRAWGLYEFNSISDFIGGVAPIRYRRSYSLVDDPSKSGDNSVGAGASFRSVRLGFFLGDDIRLNEDFTLTLGLRADRTAFLDDPKVDPFFRDTAAPIISRSYNLKGAESGKMFTPSWQFSPRLGFRWNIRDENMTIRGGIGMFAGRIPLVWPGGAFQNNGVTIGQIDQNGGTTPIRFPNNNPVPFEPDVNKQYTGAEFGLTGTRIFPQGELNLVSRDFKMPQVLRSTLAVDKRFGQGWTVTIEGMFTKNVYETDWTNLLFDPTTRVAISGPDTRMVYDPRIAAANLRIPLRPQLTGNARNPYTNIILVSNTEGDKGYSYNFTFTIDKAFRNGLAFNANYAYGSSLVRNEGTSSVNSSNWNNMETVNGRNFNGLTISDFDLGHRVTGYVSKRFSYAKNKLATTVTLDYVGQSGSPVSYTLAQGSISNDGVNNNDLMYVPTQADLQNMVFLANTANGVTYSPAQQREMFERYIQNDSYLSRTRGRHAERNGARLPFTNILNLGIKQDISLPNIGKKTHSLQVALDMFNFTNFLNENWGRQWFANFDQVQVLQFAGFQANSTTPQYRYLVPTTPWGKPYNISDGTTLYNNTRWSAQLSLRYNF